MTGLGQDPQRLSGARVGATSADVAPFPLCGATSECSCHGSHPLRAKEKFNSACHLFEPIGAGGGAGRVVVQVVAQSGQVVCRWCAGGVQVVQSVDYERTRCT